MDRKVCVCGGGSLKVDKKVKRQASEVDRRVGTSLKVCGESSSHDWKRWKFQKLTSTKGSLGIELHKSILVDRVFINSMLKFLLLLTMSNNSKCNP